MITNHHVTGLLQILVGYKVCINCYRQIGLHHCFSLTQKVHTFPYTLTHQKVHAVLPLSSSSSSLPSPPAESSSLPTNSALLNFLDDDSATVLLMADLRGWGLGLGLVTTAMETSIIKYSTKSKGGVGSGDQQWKIIKYSTKSKGGLGSGDNSNGNLYYNVNPKGCCMYPLITRVLVRILRVYMY